MKNIKDEILQAFYELMRNPTITVYTIKNGVEKRCPATDLPITFGMEVDG
jgi:hypothetical protein